MNTDQRAKIECLIECTFLPGSYQKRFVQDLYLQRGSDKPLTDRQAWFLQRCYYLYREQIQAKCSQYPMDFVNPEPLLETEDEHLKRNLERWNEDAK